jgi:hypothetical protein
MGRFRPDEFIISLAILCAWEFNPNIYTIILMLFTDGLISTLSFLAIYEYPYTHYLVKTLASSKEILI